MEAEGKIALIGFSVLIRDERRPNEKMGSQVSRMSVVVVRCFVETTDVSILKHPVLCFSFHVYNFPYRADVYMTKKIAVKPNYDFLHLVL